MVYNSKWACGWGDLATACGGFGVGLWSSPDGQNWTAASCAHNGDNDDRPSMWVDNNPYSAVYGRMYVSLNNFNIDGGALFVTHSDDGVTWSTAVQLSTSFIRDVQLTGAIPGPRRRTPDISARYFPPPWMKAEAGLSTARTSSTARSMAASPGPTPLRVRASTRPVTAPARPTVLAYMHPIWRHMGWGEPGVGPGA